MKLATEAYCTITTKAMPGEIIYNKRVTANPKKI